MRHIHSPHGATTGTATGPDARLAAFRATHPTTRREIAGIAWEYIACGAGTETLLLLPGAPGRGEMAFSYILAFERTHRVLAPSYPAAVTTVAGLADGLAALLTAGGVERAAVLGGSFGGAVAQVLVRRHPHLVERLILEHASPPSARRARLYAMWLMLARALPEAVTRRLLLSAVAPFVRHLRVERDFWDDYYRAFLAAFPKADLLARLRVQLDFDRSCRFHVDDLAAGAGRVMIVEAGADTLIATRERAALRALYPQAHIVTFEGAPHVAMLDDPARYIAAFAAFLGEPACVHTPLADEARSPL